MYAIVDIAGQQFKVKKDQSIFVHRLQGSEGTKIEFDNVLLIDNEGKITVGSPAVDGARVAAKILSHDKGDKVIVFKKKRRKGYQKSNGHRQSFTKILIQGILSKGETFVETAAAPKKAAKPKKEVTEVTEEVAQTAPVAKKTTKKASTAAPKAAAKPAKAAAKKPVKKKKEE